MGESVKNQNKQLFLRNGRDDPHIAFRIRTAEIRNQATYSQTAVKKSV